MEAKTETSEAKKSVAGENVEETGWVSPDVLAAREGEQVEMGKDLSDPELED